MHNSSAYAVDAVRDQPALILALNETRKTLLASRLHVSSELAAAREPAEPILPGDGVWVRSLRLSDIAHVPESLDLVFLDADRRVLAAVPNSGPSADVSKLGSAVEMLELAPGTIHQSQTERGDRIVLDAIVPEAKVEVNAPRPKRAAGRSKPA